MVLCSPCVVMMQQRIPTPRKTTKIPLLKTTSQISSTVSEKNASPTFSFLSSSDREKTESALVDRQPIKQNDSLLYKTNKSKCVLYCNPVPQTFGTSESKETKQGVGSLIIANCKNGKYVGTKPLKNTKISGPLINQETVNLHNFNKQRMVKNLQNKAPPVLVNTSTSKKYPISCKLPIIKFPLSDEFRDPNKKLNFEKKYPAENKITNYSNISRESFLRPPSNSFSTKVSQYSNQRDSYLQEKRLQFRENGLHLQSKSSNISERSPTYHESSQNIKVNAIPSTLPRRRPSQHNDLKRLSHGMQIGPRIGDKEHSNDFPKYDEQKDKNIKESPGVISHYKSHMPNSSDNQNKKPKADLNFQINKLKKVNEYEFPKLHSDTNIFKNSQFSLSNCYQDSDKITSECSSLFYNNWRTEVNHKYNTGNNNNSNEKKNSKQKIYLPNSPEEVTYKIDKEKVEELPNSEFEFINKELRKYIDNEELIKTINKFLMNKIKTEVQDNDYDYHTNNNIVSEELVEHSANEKDSPGSSFSESESSKTSMDSYLVNSFKNLQKEVESIESHPKKDRIQSDIYYQSAKSSNFNQVNEHDKCYLNHDDHDIYCNIPPMATLKRPLVYGYGKPPLSTGITPYSHASIIEENLRKTLSNETFYNSEDKECPVIRSNFRETYWDYWLAKNKLAALKKSQDINLSKSSLPINKNDCCSTSERLYYDPEILLAQTVHPKSLNNTTFSEYSSNIKSHIMERILENHEANQNNDQYGSCMDLSMYDQNELSLQIDPGYYSESDVIKLKKMSSEINKLEEKEIIEKNDTKIPLLNETVAVNSDEEYADKVFDELQETLNDSSNAQIRKEYDKYPYCYYLYQKSKNSRNSYGSHHSCLDSHNAAPIKLPSKVKNEDADETSLCFGIPSSPSLPTWIHKQPESIVYSHSDRNIKATYNNCEDYPSSNFSNTKDVKGKISHCSPKISNNVNESKVENVKKSKKKYFLPTFMKWRKPINTTNEIMSPYRKLFSTYQDKQFSTCEQRINNVHEYYNSTNVDPCTSVCKLNGDETGKCKPYEKVIIQKPLTKDTSSNSSSSSSSTRSSNSQSSQDSIKTIIPANPTVL